MSYPGPPGFKPVQNPSSAASPHPSLPARPPPSTVPPVAFKPAFNSASSFPSANAGRSASYASPGFQSFQPRQLSAQSLTMPPTGFQTYQQPQYSPSAYYEAPQEQSYAAPQIRNPFPLPGQAVGQGAGRFDHAPDPEMEAQIAQWQSAYAGKDPNDSRGQTRRFGITGEGSSSATSANAAPLGGRPDGPSLSSHAVNSAVNPDTGIATVVSGADGKQATVVRSGGGKQWTDSTLLDWDPSHYRIFVGNLAGEVSDDTLLSAFSSRWKSAQKARVIRDKITTKSKGFGFVSFSDGDEFFEAAAKMNGKHIGGRPVQIKRSTTEIKAVVQKGNKKGKHRGNNGKDRSAGGHAKTEAGIQKPGSKTKGGLKLLG